MNWLLGGLALVLVGTLLRRLLRIGSRARDRLGGLPTLRAEIHVVYYPVAQEVETRSAILGISLNDAFEERDAHRLDVAGNLVRLSAGEWDRLARLITGLLDTLPKYLPTARGVIPVRRILADHFKSQAMTDRLRMYELLDRLMFSPKRRLQLQIGLLRRAVETLTREFRRTCQYVEQIQDPSPEVWSRFDFYFHDFDLTAKEALLAFRAMLVCLPLEALGELREDLYALVEQGVPTTSAPANH